MISVILSGLEYSQCICGENVVPVLTVADRNVDYKQVGMGKLAVELCHEI